jgi:hypothetical protein
LGRFEEQMIRSFALLAFLAGCGGAVSTIPGTKVPDTDENREIVRAVERYRLAVERRDAPALVAMASRAYWEDSGTPTGADDYGYDGLREVLNSRFQRADSIRYSMKYMGISRKGARAMVDVLIDASFSIQTPRGLERHDMRDQNQLVLEHDGQRWLFVSGM